MHLGQLKMTPVIKKNIHVMDIQLLSPSQCVLSFNYHALRILADRYLCMSSLLEVENGQWKIQNVLQNSMNSYNSNYNSCKIRTELTLLSLWRVDQDSTEKTSKERNKFYTRNDFKTLTLSHLLLRSAPAKWGNCSTKPSFHEIRRQKTCRNSWKRDHYSPQ